MRQRQLRSVISYVCVALALTSAFSFGAAIVIAATTPPTTSLERFDLVTGELTRRIALAETKLELLGPDVAVMKSDMAEVKWIARGAAGAIVLQIIMVAFGVRMKRTRESDVAEAG